MTDPQPLSATDLIAVDPAATPADLLAAYARAKAVEDILGDHLIRVRRLLSTAVVAASTAAGAAVTVRSDIGTATMTAPQPTLRVNRPDVAGPWLADHTHPDDHAVWQGSPTVEVNDPDGAAYLLEADHGDDTDWRRRYETLAACLTVVRPWKIATDLPTLRPRRDGTVVLVDPATGAMSDPVPGLSATVANSHLQVRVSPAARAALVAQARAALTDGSDL